MKTLVLDKSALEAAPPGLLRRCRRDFDFLLTGHLFQEIGTEKLAQRHLMSASELDALDHKLQMVFKRAVDEAGENWIDHTEALKLEVTQGRSSKGIIGKNVTSLPSLKDLANGEVHDQCNIMEKVYADLASLPHDPSFESDFRRLQRTPEATVLEDFAAKTKSKEYIRYVSESAITAQWGWMVSPNFRPTPDWLAYGIFLAHYAYFRWKWAKFGDEPADRVRVHVRVRAAVLDVALAVDLDLPWDAH